MAECFVNYSTGTECRTGRTFVISQMDRSSLNIPIKTDNWKNTESDIMKQETSSVILFLPITNTTEKELLIMTARKSKESEIIKMVNFMRVSRNTMETAL